jgi:hypothetical protein
MPDIVLAPVKLSLLPGRHEEHSHRLSRSRGRDTIRLLSDFDENLFKTHPDPDLEAEMQRLSLIATAQRGRFKLLLSQTSDTNNLTHRVIIKQRK